MGREKMDPLWRQALEGGDGARDQIAQQASGHARRRLYVGGVRGSDLECLSQETVLKVFKALDDGRPVRVFSAFVKVEARGVLKAWRDHSSQSREATMEDFPEVGAVEPSPVELVVNDETLRDLSDCLDGLTPALREVAQLRLEDLSSQDIADRLGIARNTVNVRAFRAGEKVQRCMEAKGYQS